MADKQQKKTLAVIGGGAAGFFCAVNAAAAAPHLHVIVLEKTSKLLSKVRISGGGRCNVTHNCDSIATMAARYPRGANFVRKTFHRFFTADTIDWFARRGVTLKTEPDGRMFPVTDSSQTIIDCLLQEAGKYKVDIRMNAGVESLHHDGNRFILALQGGRSLEADDVVIACGGYPKASMFDWIRATGHTAVHPVPSLFTFNVPRHPITALMGVSVSDAQVKIGSSKLKEQGPVLITHWGLSGPAILRLSAWGARELEARNWHFPVQVNWLPAFHEESMKDELQRQRQKLAGQKISNRNPFGLPTRLWEFLLQEAGIAADLRWADLPAKEQNRLVKQLCGYELSVAGKTTYKDEFVTAGGITLAEVDPQTMMSRKIPGLYFAGEVLDIDGITGGFNFQNAWTTGYIAAKAITEK